ncbi:hypothetical protein Y032_0030g2110 [Ancylostoma ceylanicum]|uniref:Uncharacterized protein n=1 Tax=Ancylostoma ceylanicum TaxID=53326 RepID=A0A016URK3_9BILA|nr:hypothetical protein Y032_0030g2110 [Ancylostoma ceylanicum]
MPSSDLNIHTIQYKLIRIQANISKLATLPCGETRKDDLCTYTVVLTYTKQNLMRQNVRSWLQRRKGTSPFAAPRGVGATGIRILRGPRDLIS